MPKMAPARYPQTLKALDDVLLHPGLDQLVISFFSDEGTGGKQKDCPYPRYKGPLGMGLGESLFERRNLNAKTRDGDLSMVCYNGWVRLLDPAVASLGSADNSETLQNATEWAGAGESFEMIERLADGYGADLGNNFISEVCLGNVPGLMEKLVDKYDQFPTCDGCGNYH
jgi:hypothetical protein